MTGQATLSGQALSDEIRRLDQMVARARHELSEGSLVDLSPMEGIVDVLCGSLGDLPADEGKVALPALHALLDDLGHLSKALDDGLSALKDELGDQSKRVRGMAAYGKSPGPRKYR